MSVIFGILKPAREQVTREELSILASATERYALDGTYVRASGNLGMGFQPYHTHLRSNLESQPVSDEFGNHLVFDGRIDNHAELRNELGISNKDASDSVLILAGFERWGRNCFSRLIGDWALAIISGRDDTIYLARDHAGTRTFYYQIIDRTVRWATYLESFFANDEKYPLDEQFAARFLSASLIGNLTPYAGIRAVPPAHFLTIRNGTVTQTPHWEWVAENRLHLKSDAEYEDHFLDLFRQSVARRTGTGAPILAELSGGMDSTSIVCMSDHIRTSQGEGVNGILDTVSYFDPGEPNWNEQPYFSISEARRGKEGIHIQTSFADSRFEPCDPALGPRPLPGADRATENFERQILTAMQVKNCRVILSGVGGDELLGGVPTPMPELADYLISLQPVTLLRQATQWSIARRTPLIQTLLGAARTAIRLYLGPRPASPIPSWIQSRLKQLLMDTFRREARHETPFLALPSSKINGQMWWPLIETLPHSRPSPLARFEYRCPYLDRDLVNFLFQVPREQLVRPGRRRSLMRRALRSLVPPEVLERRRKAQLSKTPVIAFFNARSALRELSSNLCAADIGLIDQAAFVRSMDLVTSGEQTSEWPMLMRAILFEIWLRSNAGLSCWQDLFLPEKERPSALS
jgi:asparagine synthase (glutamine-hydrolysing)